MFLPGLIYLVYNAVYAYGHWSVAVPEGGATGRRLTPCGASIDDMLFCLQQPHLELKGVCPCRQLVYFRKYLRLWDH